MVAIGTLEARRVVLFVSDVPVLYEDIALRDGHIVPQGRIPDDIQQLMA